MKISITRKRFEVAGTQRLCGVRSKHRSDSRSFRLSDYCGVYQCNKKEKQPLKLAGFGCFSNR